MGKNDTGMMGFVSTFAAAQTAIIAGAGISYPFDTVRRRLQMQAEKPVEQHIYKGTVDCLKKIAAGGHCRWRLQGFRRQRAPQCRRSLGAGALRPSQELLGLGRLVANEISRPESFACFFQFDAPTSGSKSVRSPRFSSWC